MSVLRFIISVLIIYLVIGLLWRGVEKLIYGHVTPRYIDDIVSLILSISIYYNIKFIHFVTAINNLLKS